MRRKSTTVLTPLLEAVNLDPDFPALMLAVKHQLFGTGKGAVPDNPFSLRTTPDPHLKARIAKVRKKMARRPGFANEGASLVAEELEAAQRIHEARLRLRGRVYAEWCALKRLYDRGRILLSLEDAAEAAKHGRDILGIFDLKKHLHMRGRIRYADGMWIISDDPTLREGYEDKSGRYRKGNAGLGFKGSKRGVRNYRDCVQPEDAEHWFRQAGLSSFDSDLAQIVQAEMRVTMAEGYSAGHDGTTKTLADVIKEDA